MAKADGDEAAALEERCRQAFAAEGLDKHDEYLPRLVAFCRHSLASVARNELDLERIAGVLARAHRAHVSPAQGFGAALAAQILGPGRESGLAGADDCLLQALLAPLLNTVRPDAAAVARGEESFDICPRLKQIPWQEQAKLLLATTPLEAQAYLQNVCSISRLICDAAGHQVVAVATACNDEVGLRRPMDVSAWQAGAAAWVAELLRRTEEALRAHLDDELARMERAYVTGRLPLFSHIDESGALRGSRHIRRLAVRIRFTRLIDEARDVSGAARWIQSEIEEAERWASQAESTQSDAEARHQHDRTLVMSFYSAFLAELRDTAVKASEALERDGAGAATLEALGEMRACYDGKQVEFRVRLPVEGEMLRERPERPIPGASDKTIDVAQPYTFELQGSDAMLVVTDVSRMIRRAIFAEFVAARPGIVAAISVAGTGKTEVMKDTASELGRNCLVINAGPIHRQPHLEKEVLKVIMRNARVNPGGFFVFDELHMLGANVKGFLARLLESQAGVRADAIWREKHHSNPPLGFVGMTWNPEAEGFADTFHEFVSVFGESRPPDVGRKNCACWGPATHATYLELEKPDMASILRTLLSGKGIPDGQDLMPAWMAFAEESRRLSEEARKTCDGFWLLGERPSPGGGVVHPSLHTLKEMVDFMAPFAPADCLTAFASAVAAKPSLVANRSIPDRDRPPEAPTILTFAVEAAVAKLPAGDASAFVQLALRQREHTLAWSRKHNCKLELDEDNHCPIFPLTSMDLAMLVLDFPHLALDALEHPGLLGLPDPDHCQARRVLLEEVASLDGLLPALLASKAVDQLLGKPAFVALVNTKLKALWPFILLEVVSLLGLASTYVAWARGAGEACGAVAVVLAVIFGVIELRQMWAACHPLLGDPRKGQLLQHFTDPYNIIDVLAVTLVLGTALSPAAATPEAQAVTIFFLLLKLIGILRALEAFGFFIAMLLHIAWNMRPFGLLFVLMIGGFAAIFDQLAPRLDPLEEPLYLGSLAKQLWAMYRLGTLGDFDADDYEASSWAHIFFVVLTLVVNIMMLNVLITIVGEGYGQAQANRGELGRQARASIVVDLEHTFLPATRAVRRGRPCRLVRYPRILTWAAGLDILPVQHLHRCNLAPADLKDWSPPLPLLEIAVRVAAVEEVQGEDLNRQREQTERALLRRSMEDIHATLHRLTDRVEKLSAERTEDKSPTNAHRTSVPEGNLFLPVPPADLI